MSYGNNRTDKGGPVSMDVCEEERKRRQRKGRFWRVVGEVLVRKTTGCMLGFIKGFQSSG